MTVIGFRAAPGEVVYAIIDKAANDVIDVDKIVIPKAFEVPDALKYVRGNVLDILREYKVVRAGVRVTEPNAQRMSITRIQLEGVIIEAFASSPLKEFYVGQISSISARLEMRRADLKPLLTSDEFDRIENWDDF